MTVPDPTLMCSQEPLAPQAVAQLARPVLQEPQRAYPARLVNIRIQHKTVFVRDARQDTSVSARVKQRSNASLATIAASTQASQLQPAHQWEVSVQLATTAELANRSHSSVKMEPETSSQSRVNARAVRQDMFARLVRPFCVPRSISATPMS